MIPRSSGRSIHSVGVARISLYVTLLVGPSLSLKSNKSDRGDGAERQLFENAFHDGVPMATFTDGREWEFFLPAEQGAYVDRRVYKLDIAERDTKECAQRLERYLLTLPFHPAPRYTLLAIIIAMCPEIGKCSLLSLKRGLRLLRMRMRFFGNRRRSR